MSSLPPQAQETDAPNPPQPPTPTTTVSEPPLKRMKVDGVQLPHYNSHNIYSRPPVAASSNNSSTNNASLPAIVPPVSPLQFIKNSNNNSNDPMYANSTIAPLPQPSELWPLCAFCNKTGDLSRCSSCRQTYYCNRECQVAHWEVHSIVCHPGPPQPPSLPKAGQIIAPPPPRPPMSRSNSMHSMHSSPKYTPRSYNDNVNGGGSQRANGAVADDGSGREQYYCEECDRYFKNGQALGGHRSRVHSSRRNGGAGPGMPNGPQQGGMSMQCTPVGGAYNMSPAMNGSGGSQGNNGIVKKRKKPKQKRNINHVNGAYICPHCGRTFSSGNALGGHISGAHTKKARKLAEQQAMYAQQQRYARPNHPM